MQMEETVGADLTDADFRSASVATLLTIPVNPWRRSLPDRPLTVGASPRENRIPPQQI